MRRGPACSGQEVLDAGPVAAPFPVGLEAIGGLVDPGSLASQGVAHAFLLQGSQSIAILRICVAKSSSPAPKRLKLYCAWQLAWELEHDL